MIALKSIICIALHYSHNVTIMMASPIASNAILMLLSGLLVRPKASMGIFQEGKPCPGFCQQEENVQNPTGLVPLLAIIRLVLSALHYHSLFCTENNKLSAEVEYC